MLAGFVQLNKIVVPKMIASIVIAFIYAIAATVILLVWWWTRWLKTWREMI